MKLSQLLISSNYKKRIKGFIILRKYLQRPQGFKEEDMYKIWFAIYESYWIVDTNNDQENFCEALSGFLYDYENKELLLMFIKGFWWMICTEWGKIDNWRISKYMRMVRVMYHEIIEVLFKRNWDMKLCKSLHQQICDWPLNGTKGRRGICNHMCDIMFEELNEIVIRYEHLPFPTFFQILNPFLKLFTIHKDKFFVKRCKEKIFFSLIKQMKEQISFQDIDPLEVYSKVIKLTEHLLNLIKEKSLEQLNRNFLYDLKRDIDIVLCQTLIFKSKENADIIRNIPFLFQKK